jgi:hypothetical protein
MVLEIITYGGGSALNTVFEALARLGQSNIMGNLIFITFSIAYIHSVITQMAENNLRQEIVRFFFALLFIGAMVCPTCSVLIIDEAVNQEKKIDNVPLGIALIGSIVSQVTDYTTKGFELHFSIPDDSFASFRKGGVLFVSTILKEASAVGIQDPRLERNFRAFTRQCIIPDIRIKARYTLERLAAAENMWALIRDNTSPLRGFDYDNGTQEPQFMVCRAGARELDRDLTREANAHVSLLSFKLAGTNGTTKTGAAEPGGQKKLAVAKKAILEFLQPTHEIFTRMTGDSFEILKQHMVRNYLITSAQKNAMVVNASAAAQAYGIARAKEAQANSMFISGQLAPENLVYLYTVFQELSYAAFAIVILLLPFNIGFSVLRKYIGLVVWVHSWPIVFAIINCLQTDALYNATIAAANFVDPTNGTAHVFWNLFTNNQILEANRRIALITGTMISSVPVITLFLVYGAGQAVHVASGWFRSQDAAADSSAHSMTDGRVDGDSVNINNRSIGIDTRYKLNTHAEQHGMGATFDLMSGSRLSTTPGGDLVLDQTGSLSRTAASFRLSDAIQSSIQQQSMLAQNAMYSAQENYTNALAASTTSGIQLALNDGFNVSSGQHYGHSESNSFGHAVSDLKRFTTQFSHDNGITEQQTASLLAQAHLSSKLGLPTKLVTKAISKLGNSDGDLTNAERLELDSMGGGVSPDNLGKAGKIAKSVGKILNFGPNLRVDGGVDYKNSADAAEKFQKLVNFYNENNLDNKFDEIVRGSKDLHYNESNERQRQLADTHRQALENMERASHDYHASMQHQKSISDLANLSKLSSATVEHNLQQLLVEQVANMHDSEGNRLGFSGADKLLNDPIVSKPYIEQVVEKHIKDVGDIYQQHALNPVDLAGHYEEGKDRFSSMDEMMATSHREAEHIRELAKHEELNNDDPNRISTQAKAFYEQDQQHVREEITAIEERVVNDGTAHTEMVDAMRDQKEKGLLHRSANNFFNNIGGKDKDKVKGNTGDV